MTEELNLMGGVPVGALCERMGVAVVEVVDDADVRHRRVAPGE